MATKSTTPLTDRARKLSVEAGKLAVDLIAAVEGLDAPCPTCKTAFVDRYDQEDIEMESVSIRTWEEVIDTLESFTTYIPYNLGA